MLGWILLQLLVIVLVFVYIYFTFRHVVRIPSAAENIEKISPGLAQLATDGRDKIVFWFYSLSQRAYIKYTLDANKNIEMVNDGDGDDYNLPERVKNLSSGYYFNVGKQRWERKIPIDSMPRFVRAGSLEQRFRICYLTGRDGDDGDTNTNINDDGYKEICQETKLQTFVQLEIRDDVYEWKNEMLTLSSSSSSSSSFPKDRVKCKFTTNRYRQYLGLAPLTSTPDNDIERDLNIYFEYEKAKGDGDDGVWKLRKCERPDSIFDGETCISVSRSISTPLPIIGTNKAIKRVNELFTQRTAKTERITNKRQQDMNIYRIQLNSEHSTFVDLNVEQRIYVYEEDFYRSCDKTIFLVCEGDDGGGGASDCVWSLKQIINNNTRENLLQQGQQLCPILEDWHKVWHISTGEIVSLEQPFVVFHDELFHVDDNLLTLVAHIQSIKGFRIVTKSDGNVQNVQLLPHLREYSVKNKHNTMCRVYAMYVGAVILDMYIETRLLVDFVDNVHKYDFYLRPMFPTIVDDFQLDTWSCVHDGGGDNTPTQMFTYIALVDMYPGLRKYATASIPTC